MEGLGLGDQSSREQTILEALVLEHMVCGTQLLVPLASIEGQGARIANPGGEPKCRCASNSRQRFDTAKQERANAAADERRLHIQATQFRRGTLGDQWVGRAQRDASEGNEEPVVLGEQNTNGSSPELLKKRSDREFLLRFTGDGLANTLLSVSLEEHLRCQRVKAKRVCFTSLANNDVGAHGT